MAIGLADLDELALQCRDARTLPHLREAIDCYKAGAVRASIVALWIAVVHDIIAKLDDLALAGDTQAGQRIAEYREIHHSHDVVRALKFERSILATAKAFELLSELEYKELARILEDRDKCAHPSLIADGEPYTPRAEAARYHIRNAVDSLFSQVAAQGRAALERLMNELDSPLFPDVHEDVVARLRTGPLGRPRRTLLRKYLLLLFKRLLLDDPTLPTDPMRKWQMIQKRQQLEGRVVLSLRAVLDVHPVQVREVLVVEANSIVSHTSDARMGLVIACLHAIPEMFDLVGSVEQNRLRLFIEREAATHVARLLPIASAIAGLRSDVEARALGMSAAEWSAIDPALLPAAWIDMTIQKYANSPNYDSANALARNVLLPIAARLSRPQAEAVVACFRNSQVRDSIAGPSVLAALAAQVAIGCQHVVGQLALIPGTDDLAKQLT